MYIQLQYSLLLHLGLQPPPQAVVLPQAPAVHATQRILLELTTHNSNALGVHFSHTFQQMCNCGIIVRHSIQLVLRPLFLHRQAQTHCLPLPGHADLISLILAAEGYAMWSSACAIAWCGTDKWLGRMLLEQTDRLIKHCFGMTPLHVARKCRNDCLNQYTHRKQQARVQLGSKTWQMQDAGLGHSAFAVPDLDVTPDDQIVDL